MDKIITWFGSGGTEVVLVGIGLVSGIISFAVGLTKSKSDDAKWASIQGFLYRLGILRRKDEPGTLKWPLQGPTGEVVVQTVKSGPPPAK